MSFLFFCLFVFCGGFVFYFLNYKYLETKTKRFLDCFSFFTLLFFLFLFLSLFFFVFSMFPFFNPTPDPTHNTPNAPTPNPSPHPRRAPEGDELPLKGGGRRWRTPCRREEGANAQPKGWTVNRHQRGVRANSHRRERAEANHH